MLGNWLDYIQAVLEALSVNQELAALVRGTAAGERFEIHHNYLGGGHIIAAVAYNLDIIGLHS